MIGGWLRTWWTVYGPGNRYLVGVYAWGLFLVFLLVVPLPRWQLTAPSQLFLDKIVHALLFFSFALMLVIALHRHPDIPGTPIRWMVLAVVISSLLGAVLEGVQWVVPGRSPSLLDFLANTVGVVSAQGLYWWWTRRL